MKTYWIEIFKSGSQTDSAGNKKEWKDSDLDTMVAKYEAAKGTHEAPIVIGHPKTDAPAYGWVNQLKREGSTLLAEIKQLSKEFIEAVNLGQYKKRSIALYPDMTLKHVGFLGAVPPAVKGLGDVSFSTDKESILFEFSEEVKLDEENEDSKIYKLFKEFAMSIKEQVSVLLSKQPKLSEEEKNSLVDSLVAKFEELHTKDGDPPKDEKDPDKKEDTPPKEEFQEKDDPEKIALQKRVDELEKINRQSQFEAYAEGQVKAGKILPAQKANTVVMLENAYLQDSLQFADGAKTPTIDSVKAFIESNPIHKLTDDSGEGKSSKSSEFAEYDVDEESDELNKKVVEYREAQSKAGRTLTFIQAYSELTKKGAN